jgi:hypothetical protein
VWQNKEKREVINMKEKHEKKLPAYDGDNSEMRKAPGYTGAVPGVNSPEIELTEFNPPVPNRAWTEMKKDIAKRDKHIKNDNIG